ncbi:TIGR04222 domain-containing membrane protein [Streptomyces sp. NPDC091272]|uniref:TIGR04222 domain-containing membrane protein n=1 Tax=Streptomyces sp. NPDC091272 TaxID=3365981 RepID=UPI0038279CD8
MFWVALLLVSWLAALAACARLCIAATVVAAADSPVPDVPPQEGALTLPETAFLSGGPERVADLTLVTMHAGRRLMLAHTGWTTVVAPRGTNALECAAIGAAGPGGQARTTAVRAGVAAADPVRELSDRLVASGLAVPEHARHAVAAGVGAVRRSFVLVLALAVVSVLVLPQEPAERGEAALWFSLPLVLTLGCLAIARLEVHPYVRWASAAGLARLRELPRPTDGHGPDGHDGLGNGALPGGQALLVSVALGGIGAIPDPQLRTALAGPVERPRPAHRGQ